MSTPMSAGRVRAAYQFIKAQRATFSVQTLCRVLDVGAERLLRMAEAATLMRRGVPRI
ncbi:MAG TPA: hypothetical protein VK595_06655 [Vicinamibacterales bacterium]|nr:hypothetical protein [Vicinamibacterales bacterium]